MFHGCYDFHSALHGHWALLRLSRLLHDGANNYGRMKYSEISVDGTRRLKLLTSDQFTVMIRLLTLTLTMIRYYSQSCWMRHLISAEKRCVKTSHSHHALPIRLNAWRAEALQQDIAYLRDNPSFELPYGRAWGIKLWLEVVQNPWNGSFSGRHSR